MSARPYRPNAFSESGRQYTAMKNLYEKTMARNAKLLETIKQLRATIKAVEAVIEKHDYPFDWSGSAYQTTIVAELREACGKTQQKSAG